MSTVTFPEFRDELIALGKEDQATSMNLQQQIDDAESDDTKNQLRDNHIAACHRRAERAIQILETIKQPRISYIGEEASSIISLLALHSYLDEMKFVLAAFEAAFASDRDDVYAEAIPSLTDRIMVLESRKQSFGNNWSVDENGKFYLIPVEDFAHMNERRAHYGLGPRMRLRNLSVGAEEYPLGRGEAQESDQREMSDEEHREWRANHIRGSV